MSNLPKGWEEVNFDNFFKTISAKKYQIQKKDYLQKSIYPVIDQGQKFIIAYSNQSDKLLKNSSGLIIFGDHTRIIKFIDFDFIVGADGTQILDTKSNVDIKFAYYTLLFKEIVSLGYSRHFKIIKEFNYLVPPLEEQKKIADILSTVDKKIAFVEENINATEELKKGLMQKLFTEGIGHTEFKDSELGRIPKSWEVVELLKVCEDNKRAIVDGPFGSNLKTIHFREEGIPVIQSNFVTSGKFNAKEYVYVDEDKFNSEIRSKVIGGDIVMAKIGANCGTSAIIPLEHPNALLSGNSIKISVDQNKASTVFIDFIFKSMYSRNKLVELKSVGAQPAISMPLLKKMKIVKPLLEEQKQIAEILSTVDKKIENLKEKKQSFEELKKGLMQKLLTGEVRV